MPKAYTTWATGVWHNTGILILFSMLFLSIYIYLVCNFVISRFPAGYDVPMGDTVAARC